MKTHPLLAAGALALVSCNASAYQIIQSHYHVQVGPNKYVDQLVLRCEDGKEITVPWQSKLAESCGEDLMGNVTRPQTDSKAAPVDDQQKQAVLNQLRSQYGNISEKQVEFAPDATGTATHFKGPMVEVLKRYESCRKARKDKAFCAAERDRAMAKLSDPEPVAAPQAESQKAVATPGENQKAAAAQTENQKAAPAQTENQKAAASESGAKAAPAEIAPAPASAEAARTEPVAAAPAQAGRSEPAAAAAPAASAPAAAPQPTDAEVRAAAERKIAEDYATCMRTKPKFECEQSRSRALSALDAPKPAKLQRPRKQADASAQTQASR